MTNPIVPVPFSQLGIEQDEPTFFNMKASRKEAIKNIFTAKIKEKSGYNKKVAKGKEKIKDKIGYDKKVATAGTCFTLNTCKPEITPKKTTRPPFYSKPNKK